MKRIAIERNALLTSIRKRFTTESTETTEGKDSGRICQALGTESRGQRPITHHFKLDRILVQGDHRGVARK